MVWALIVDIVLLAAVIFAGFQLMQTARRGFRIAGMCIVGISSLFAIFQMLHGASRMLYEHNLNAWGSGAHFVKIAAAALIAVFLIVRSRLVLKVVRALFWIFAPAAILFPASTLWAYHEARVHYPGPGSAAGLLGSTSNQNRVVWIIFDELDARLLNNTKPQWVQTPQFDRFRSQALVGTQTTSPAHDTLFAIPSLLTGKFVADATPRRAYRTAGWTSFAAPKRSTSKFCSPNQGRWLVSSVRRTNRRIFAR